MGAPQENRAYALRLWFAVVPFGAFVAYILIDALLDPARRGIALVAIVVGAVVIALMRRGAHGRLEKILLAEDPRPLLQSFEPAGTANAALILALFGAPDEGEQKLDAASWDGAPPIVRAQESAARAVIAYVRGEFEEGLDHAVAAAQLGEIDGKFPGGERSELALRTFRNLGLALSGRATATTAEELRAAHAKLPLVGQLLAAWGLAAIAKRESEVAELATMRTFIEKRAPHFAPVLASIR